MNLQLQLPFRTRQEAAILTDEDVRRLVTYDYAGRDRAYRVRLTSIKEYEEKKELINGLPRLTGETMMMQCNLKNQTFQSSFCGVCNDRFSHHSG